MSGTEAVVIIPHAPAGGNPPRIISRYGSKLDLSDYAAPIRPGVYWPVSMKRSWESAPQALTLHRADGILPDLIAGARDIVHERPREQIAPAGAVPIQPSLEESRIHGSRTL